MAWSPRRKRWVLLGAVASAVGVVVGLLILFVPLSPESSGYARVGAHLYTYESENLFGVGNGWNNYSYRDVTFGFHLWCGPPSPGGAALCGNATGGDGVPHPYTFFDGRAPAGPPPWQTWVAGDAREAVQYQDGGLVHLLVIA
ncbi:MAG: hypothetical protein L3K08_02590 [Thermoplasmata archaeon]|nr:hypothetical protein [Thermoplasmata archaeon]MCI4366620.1 hypothetical protein [Thermoplasmata archaeon]